MNDDLNRFDLNLVNAESLLTEHGIYIEIIQTICSKRCENALNK